MWEGGPETARGAGGQPGVTPGAVCRGLLVSGTGPEESRSGILLWPGLGCLLRDSAGAASSQQTADIPGWGWRGQPRPEPFGPESSFRSSLSERLWPAGLHPALRHQKAGGGVGWQGPGEQAGHWPEWAAAQGEQQRRLSRLEFGSVEWRPNQVGP